MKTILATLLASTVALAPLAAAAESCTNAGLKRIQDRGTLIAGVKADYKPWGYRDTAGNIVGLEIDMAQMVADTLGVKLELVPVIASNRMQFLQQGQIDLMIATMTDTADRRAMVGIKGPNYYASGTAALTPKAMGLTDWNALRGKPVCGVQGSFYLQKIEQEYGATIAAFGNAAEAKQALRDKKCVAFVYDDTTIGADYAAGGWDDFEISLPVEDFAPWGLAVAKSEESCALGQIVSGLQYAWHRDGTLIELEKKWGVAASPFLADMHARMADPLAQ
ncbi:MULTISPECIES: transporter substrate-binding domain-containing protein [Paracoccus]|uniref:transporter substrate-binding domain-containing protein n=1 Tax=Paracoccus TaxID=265 RepID=UPI0009228A81|nr:MULTISPECIES: transporter substrate-binding domain-containing protein [Paracoccus]MCJ1902468.1 transporter substrate-binding domain-containing protein [Paracoccus versutus]MDF3907085.1 transporter substrate-binding domain-containing protein [Paracoccus sp. AS002]SFY43800.1 amino acid ABC transporter substrate-binding protein, PAAT family [Paracoccus pantotrophus]